MSHELQKRGKGKYTKDFTLKDIYKYYKEEHPNDEFAVDEKTYRKIILWFNKRAMQMILEDAREFILPYRLGVIRVRKRRQDIVNNKPHIDFGLSRKLNKTVYHLNDHTDGYYYRFFWSKIGCNAKNYTAYFFKAGRTNERKISELIKAKKIDYYL